jgi:hypothetical protein
MHSPFLVDVETFVRHRWFAMPEPLELVVGTELALEEPPAHQLLRELAGIEGLVVSRLKLAKQLFTGRIKVRPFLCELHNVRHGLRLTGISEAVAPRAWTLTTEILAVRDHWWKTADQERDRRVIELASLAPLAIDEALAAFSALSSRAATASPMRLSVEWDNVTLTSQPVEKASFELASLFGRVSRKAAELIWRHERHELALPNAVVSLLSAATTAADEVLAERLAVVRRYAAFMDTQDTGWSSIGLARIFTDA